MGRCSQRLRGSVPTPAITAATCPVSAAAAGAILTIDLGAIRDNYRSLQAQLGGVPAAAVVKADGYGLGAAEVAPALAEEGCGTSSSPSSARRLALRAALGRGADNPRAERHYARRGETPAPRPASIPVLNSPSSSRLAGGGRACRAHARRDAAGRQRHVAARHGAGRGRARSRRSRRLRRASTLRLVMSHLACADEPDHPANEAQRARFETLRAKAAGRRRRRSPIRRASSSARPSTSTSRGRVRRSTASTRRRDSRTRCGRWCGCRRRSSRRATLPEPASASATAMPFAPSGRMRAGDDLARLCRWLAAPRRRRRPGATACGCPSSAASRWTASSSTSRRCRRAG